MSLLLPPIFPSFEMRYVFTMNGYLLLHLPTKTPDNLLILSPKMSEAHKPEFMLRLTLFAFSQGTFLRLLQSLKSTLRTF